ncbi:ABC transporter ATP-binding protein [Fodinicurvata sp. EGI_FJ10296]|uniref:metal ABC transporter ATP-binding protein n=1 Tax=Fodinicurvata sp. EGI_FJ10296 TaxID=3231908 RepID=UPI0034546E6A
MVKATASVDVEGICLAYGRTTVVEGVDGSFEPGSMTAVIGPNGAGKSTLSKALVGLIRPARGVIRLHGQQIAYLPQRADIDSSFPISVRDAVQLGLWPRLGGWRGVSRDDRDRVDAALEAVGLASLARRVVGDLSVGQLQRVFFARLMVQDAPVILLDEPFNAVDEATVSDLLEITLGWRDEGRTVIAVLHDQSQVRHYFPDCLVLDRTVKAWGPTASILGPISTIPRSSDRRMPAFGAESVGAEGLGNGDRGHIGAGGV